MKKAFCFLILLLSPGVLLSQPVNLTLKGDGVKVVKIDVIRVFKEDVTVIQSFPFSISAPPGAGLYFWSFPVGVNAVDKGDLLEVASAPKGSLTISVKSISADIDPKTKEFKGFKTAFGSITFNVGDVPKPPPIDPVDPVDPVGSEPDTVLYRNMKAAWLKESASDKTRRNELAEIYAQSINYAKKDKTLTTAKQLFDKIHKARLAVVEDFLPQVRVVLTAHMDQTLPTSINAPLDDATREKCAATFDQISKYLRRLP